ncbi:MAG: 3'-5' exonuclease [Rhodobacteraceae bacterium]|nr:3'-5' exonuclease [Paracoccaceae bacterium]
MSDWHDMLNRDDVLIVDTETTGVKGYDEVVQVACIDTTGAVCFDELVFPTIGIPQEASRIHGITEQMLQNSGAMTWPVHHERFFSLIASAATVFVYNLNFDERLLKQTCRKHRLGFKPFPGRCAMLDYAAYRKVPNQWNSGFKWHRLTDAARYEGARTQGAIHKASTDCEIVLELMRAVAARQSG